MPHQENFSKLTEKKMIKICDLNIRYYTYNFIIHHDYIAGGEKMENCGRVSNTLNFLKCSANLKVAKFLR